MSFFVENTSGSYERCPAGVHLARCYSIIDLGTQKNEFIVGQIKFLHKIRFTWEVHVTSEENKPLLMKDGRPYSIHKEYTLSWNEKATMRLDLQSWRGKPFNDTEMRKFDLKTILGVWCQLNIIDRAGKKDGTIYANVDSITPVPSFVKANGLPEGINPIEIFNISDPDMKLFESFSDYIKNKIKASPEWGRRGDVDTVTSSAEIEDDIPF